ncbi:MAG: hypothetical protein KBS91_03620, partial [Firmicutes bacterium]|nr:hypothetical protein [Candidatus Caballimonas caccae]
MMLILSFCLCFCFACNNKNEHEHVFSTAWSYDDTYHYHKSLCEHDLIVDRARHSFSSGEIISEASHTQIGKIKYICTICGYSKEVIIPPLTEHTYSTEWSYDAISHWHNANCEHGALYKDKEEHNFEKTIIEPTCCESGYTIYTCVDCGFTYNADYI